jgi:hypothetical protein
VIGESAAAPPPFPWTVLYPRMAMVAAVLAAGVSIFSLSTQAGWYPPPITEGAKPPDGKSCPQGMIMDRAGRCRTPSAR